MTAAKRIVSYRDPLSVTRGEEVRFMVSSLDSEPFDGQLVRLICGDISPDGHGFEEVECDSAVNGGYAGKPQPLRQGSWAQVPANTFCTGLQGLRVEVCAFPTLVHGTRTLLDCWGDRGGFALEIRDGVPCFLVQAQDGTTIELIADAPIPARRWARITASYDPILQALNLAVVPLVSAPGDRVSARSQTRQRTARALVASDAALTFATRVRGSERDQYFDGRLNSMPKNMAEGASSIARRPIGNDWGTPTGVGRGRRTVFDGLARACKQPLADMGELVVLSEAPL